MHKSVWLTKVIISAMNNPRSVLFRYYKCLNDKVKAHKGNICLKEPDGNEMTLMLVSDITTCVIPVASSSINSSLMATVMERKECAYLGNLLYAPLYMENTNSFGVIIFEEPQGLINHEDLKDEIVAFSSILYSESMGSIINSSHKTVMRTEDLCVDFPQGKGVNHVLKNINLEINEHEFTIIAGSSGCGKSTLLNVLGGMLTATSGTVWWKDSIITTMTEKECTQYRGSTVGFIFQRYNLISDLTAEENIKIAASLVDNPLPVSDVLKMVGLEGKANSYPSQLSGGQQQRICIARALVKHADVLLCDEPTGALDTENAGQIITILQHISKEQGIPVVVITHNPSLTVLADHFITLSNGTIVDDRLQPFALSAEKLKMQ